MKVTDIIFALICGRFIGFLVDVFLRDWGIEVGIYYTIGLWVLLPVLTLSFLWVAAFVGRKIPVFFQGAKFLLVGAFSAVVDLKIFEGLVYAMGLFFTFNPLLAKGVSFVLATCVKYWGNKHWTFQKHEKEYAHYEVSQFFLVTLVGLILDVGAFYYFTKVSGPEFGISPDTWLKVSVILAALVATVFNFLGYKFWVFKK